MLVTLIWSVWIRCVVRNEGNKVCKQDMLMESINKPEYDVTRVVKDVTDVFCA